MKTKMKFSKQILSVLLCLAMLISYVPVFSLTASAATVDVWDGTTASQAWDSGSGTEADPYIIMTAAQLAKLAADVNSGTDYSGTYFKLGADLDLGGSDRTWTPIGDATYTFKGNFNGDGKTISNMYAYGKNTNNKTYGYRALFGNITGGTIENFTLASPSSTGAWGYIAAAVAYGTGVTVKNIIITNPNVTTQAKTSTGFAGGVAGHIADGVIENCKIVSGTIDSQKFEYTGGVVGCATDVQISGCAVKDVAISSTSRYVGGIVGQLQYTDGINSIENCTVENCAISSTSSAVGGVLGYSYGNSSSMNTVKNCGITGGSVNASYIGGGIVGNAFQTNVIGCYNYGATITVTASGSSAQAGGITGYNGKIYSCFSSADVLAPNSTSGRNCPFGYDATTYCCAYDKTVYTGTYTSQGKAFTTEEVRSGAATYYLANPTSSNTNYYTNWGQKIGTDLYPVWNTDNDSSIVVYREESSNGYIYFNEGTVDVFEPNEDGYYEISDTETWYKFARKAEEDSSVKGLVTAAIDFSAVSVDDIAEYRIGTEDAFTGIFDGGNKTISGLPETDKPLFGTIGTEGKLQNLTVSGATVTSRYDTAGLVLENNGTVENCTVTNVSVSGSMVGGMIGDNNGTVSNCTAENVTVSSTSSSAGLVSYNTGTIKDCAVVSGTIMADSSTKGSTYDAWAGGICGRSVGGSISGCSNGATVIANSDDNHAAAGIVAAPDKDSADQSVQVTKCFNTGAISSDYYAGGITGFYETSAYVSISLCYNTGNIEGTIAGGIAAYGSYNKNDSFINCYNAGQVNGSKAGGIAGSRGNVIIQNCHNYGKVVSTNIGAPIVGVDSGVWPGTGNLINNHAIEGNVEAPTVRSFYDTATATSSSNAVIKGSTKEQFESGEIAYLLQQANGGAAVWSQGESYPVFASDENDKVVKIDFYAVIDEIVHENSYATIYLIPGRVLTEADYPSPSDIDCTLEGCYLDRDCTMAIDRTAFTADTDTKLFVKLITHRHDWTYTKENETTITATCIADGCTAKDGGSVKLVAPTELTYNGTAKEATLQFDNWQLGDDAKPTISYNDTDKVAVTNKDIVATITLGVESASVTYKVKPASISGATVTADTVNYTGSAQTPDVSVVLNGKTLVKDTDYTVSYNNNTNAGTATVTVTGTGNYEGTATGTFTITDTAEPTGAILIKDNTWLQFLNNITFGLFFKENVDVIVTADGTGSAVDKVEYLFSSTELNKNNLPADGWKTVEGNNGTYTFAITAQNKGAVYVKITDAYGNVAVINSDGIVVYEDSKAVDTEVTYTYKENSNKDIAVEFNGNTVNSIVYGEKVLAANTDYSVDYESGKIVLKATYLDTLNAGDYTYTVSYNPMGVENSGVTDLTTTFTVKVEPTSIAGATVNVSGTFTYDGNAKTPDPVVVLNGETLVKDRDYTVSYAENVNAGTATVTVTGKGNYSGTASGSFRIERAKLTDISVQQNGKLPYDGGKALTPAVTANATALNGAKVYFIYSADGSAYGSMPTFTDAGTYTVYYCAYTVDNNFFDHHDTFTVTIDKATVTEPTIASKSYSGSAQTADVPASDLYTVEKNNGGTEEGSYDVVLKLKDSANYKWSTTDTSEVTLQFVISAAQNAWDTNPSISGWTYGEAAKTPVGTAKYGDVKVVYTGKANNGTNYNSETAPTKAGNYTATFTVTGTEDYSGLSEQVNFTIAKKAVTVTANDASKTYGESDPALTYTHTELVGSDALIITVARASGENANTYTITASQAEGANPNYEITFKTGIFTIQKAALSVTAEDKTITYGDEVPAYTVRYEGFKNGDDKDDLGGTLDFYSYYRQFDDVGEYDICPHGLESDNYVFFYYFGKLTVNAKPITVTIQNATSVYGDTLAELKATDNGIVNGDTNVYSLATTATGTSNVGKYAITGTALDSNYNVTFVNGEYEITKREITITVDAKNTVVNTTLPTYTYKVEGLVGVDTLVTEPTLTCNANIALIGEYDITASGADAGGNYSIKYVPAKLTVLTDNAVDAAAGYTEELKDYDPATVTSEDKAELDEMLSEINTILADETTTDNGKKALEEVKEQIEKLIKEINDAADATNTENVGKVENVTPENVTPENKTDLENAKADLEKALEENSGNYTEDEKKAIEDELGRIDDALEVIGNVEAVEKVISKLPSVDTVKPDDEEAIKAITDAQTAYNALSDYEKSLLDEAAKANLDKLVAALVAYDIVEGDGSSWTEDSDHNITFVVNGLFGKFVGIKVDGKDVDKANYEVKAGSTIITLKASYLDTLAVGEHTITVVYTDGSTDGTFNVHAKANSPATGDNSNMFLWVALLFISGGAVITLTVVDRKRRMASKR